MPRPVSANWKMRTGGCATDANYEGRCQDAIVDFLTGNAIGKMAHPRNPALDGSVWASAGLDNTGAAGMTMAELHGRFARSSGRTMFLKRAHFDRSLT